MHKRQRRGEVEGKRGRNDARDGYVGSCGARAVETVASSRCRGSHGITGRLIKISAGDDLKSWNHWYVLHSRNVPGVDTTCIEFKQKHAVHTCGTTISVAWSCCTLVLLIVLTHIFRKPSPAPTTIHQQIYLGVAMREALAILSAVEAAEEGSEERDEAEEMAMERVRQPT